MKRPTHCYLGISQDGKLEIVVSDYPLSPWGARLLRGDTFPSVIYDFYQDRPELAADALQAAGAYLRGEEAGSSGGQLSIGDTSPLEKKRRRKS